MGYADKVISFFEWRDFFKSINMFIFGYGKQVLMRFRDIKKCRFYLIKQ